MEWLFPLIINGIQLGIPPLANPPLVEFAVWVGLRANQYPEKGNVGIKNIGTQPVIEWILGPKLSWMPTIHVCPISSGGMSIEIPE